MEHHVAVSVGIHRQKKIYDISNTTGKDMRAGRSVLQFRLSQ
jgi:hypothetical protein